MENSKENEIVNPAFRLERNLGQALVKLGITGANKSRTGTNCS
jgi:hypothetical protein